MRLTALGWSRSRDHPRAVNGFWSLLFAPKGNALRGKEGLQSYTQPEIATEPAQVDAVDLAVSIAVESGNEGRVP